MSRIGLVACASMKLDHPAPARELYVSPLFRKAAAYCEATYDRWAILSAKYGLVWPYSVIAPYDQSLNDASASERIAWGTMVLNQLPSGAAVAFYLHAGRHYADWLARHITAELPLKGLGIGQQLAWYKARGF